MNSKAEGHYETVNNPKHYNSHPSKIEAIEIMRWLPHNPAAAIKYLWRAGLKPGVDCIEDYRKALWYINDEITHGIPHPPMSISAYYELENKISKITSNPMLLSDKITVSILSIFMERDTREVKNEYLNKVKNEIEMLIKNTQ